MLSASRWLPPGWTMAVTPAAAAASDVVPEREEGVRRQHRPLRPVARLPDGDLRPSRPGDICPAPTPTTCVPRRQHDGVRLHVLAHQPGEPQRCLLAGRRRPLRLRLPLGWSRPPPRRGSARAGRRPPGGSPAPAAGRRAGRSSAGGRSSSTSLRGEDRRRRPASKSGAMTHSTNRCRARRGPSAVAASTGRLKARMPPKAESGSPSHASANASARVRRRRPPRRGCCASPPPPPAPRTRGRGSAPRRGRGCCCSSAPCRAVARRWPRRRGRVSGSA